ncbi:YnbE family lipoprotein [Sphingorhabdus arenilitoris]|uniref:YnbE family lipoprotein n=1 Tax=Sphingorhabdus arenilitoris TaxID=1490041 RepID=A0ABV8RI10_9SPHN
MTEERLTRCVKIANRDVMKRNVCIIMATPAFLAFGGCVQVAAPDKPIEINLNIKIEQKVLLRIQGAVKDAIAENSEIF